MTQEYSASHRRRTDLLTERREVAARAKATGRVLFLVYVRGLGRQVYEADGFEFLDGDRLLYVAWPVDWKYRPKVERNGTSANYSIDVNRRPA